MPRWPLSPNPVEAHPRSTRAGAGHGRNEKKNGRKRDYPPLSVHGPSNLSSLQTAIRLRSHRKRKRRRAKRATQRSVTPGRRALHGSSSPLLAGDPPPGRPFSPSSIKPVSNPSSIAWVDCLLWANHSTRSNSVR
jgi:hypothetical protein